MKIFSEVFLEKVSLTSFFIKIPYVSLMLVFFQYYTSYQAHGYILHSVLSMQKVIPYVSLMLVFFQYYTSYHAHGYIFYSMLSIQKVESERLSWRDVTRIFSCGISFACKKGWQNIFVKAKQVHGALDINVKDYLGNVITVFLNVWNQFKESLMKNFVLFVISRDFGSDAYIFYHQLRPWENLWYWNMSVLFLVIASQAKSMVNEQESSIVIPLLGKVNISSLCFWLAMGLIIRRFVWEICPLLN